MMDEADGPILAGLDDVSWNQFGTEGREARDVLQRLASRDAMESSEAVIELSDQVIWGDASSTFAMGVPYLARLAAAGTLSAEILSIMGRVSDIESADGGGVFRDAVVDARSLVLPLARNEDPTIRERAIYALCAPGRDDGLSGQLSDMWATEANDRVRVSFLFGCGHVPSPSGAQIIESALGFEEPDAIRVAALVNFAVIGGKWREELTTALLSLLPFENTLGRTPWTDSPFKELVMTLCQRGDVSIAVELISRALADARDSGKLAYGVVRSAQEVGNAIPSVRSLLIDALLPLVNSPDDEPGVVKGALKAWRVG